MSVYEIEQTIERLGEAVRDIDNKDMEISGEGMTAQTLKDQLKSWEDVLTKYRNTEKTTSVAAQLQQVMDGLRVNFTEFYVDMQKDAPSELTEFVAGGIENLVRLKGGEDADTTQSKSEMTQADGTTDKAAMEENKIEGNEYIENNVGTVGGRVREAAKS